MLISAALMAASLSAVQDERFELPEMPDVDSATQEEIQAYLDLLQNSLEHIDSIDTFGAYWSRFITEGAALTSDYEVIDPYLLTAGLTRVYADLETRMDAIEDEHDWGIAMDIRMNGSETTSTNEAEREAAVRPPLSEDFCVDGQISVIEPDNAPYGERLDLCLQYGPDEERDGRYFAVARIIHRYAYEIPDGSASGRFEVHVAASISDDRNLEYMRRTTRDLAEMVVEQIRLAPEAGE